ncbi:MAG: hypothetical protein ACKV0T_12790 [Planctomycetales bacterium]
MPKRFLISVVCGILIVVGNALLVPYWWTNRQRVPDEPVGAADARSSSTETEYDKANREEEKRKEVAWSRFDEWSDLPSVPLEDAEAVHQGVRSILWDGFPLQAEATGLLTKASLSSAQATDLDQAVEQFIGAFAANSPHAVIAFMRERGLEFNPELAKIYIRYMHKKTDENLDSLSGDELFVRCWELDQCATRWHGIMFGATMGQIWDGSIVKNVRAVAVLGGLRDEPTPVSDLYRDLRGVTTRTCTFRPVQGSLEQQQSSGGQLLVADLQMIIQYHETLDGKVGPYILRLWYNSAAEKWQPFVLAQFASGVHLQTRPKIQF